MASSETELPYLLRTMIMDLLQQNVYQISWKKCNTQHGIRITIDFTETSVADTLPYLFFDGDNKENQYTTTTSHSAEPFDAGEDHTESVQGREAVLVPNKQKSISNIHGLIIDQSSLSHKAEHSMKTALPCGISIVDASKQKYSSNYDLEWQLSNNSHTTKSKEKDKNGNEKPIAESTAPIGNLQHTSNNYSGYVSDSVKNDGYADQVLVNNTIKPDVLKEENNTSTTSTKDNTTSSSSWFASNSDTSSLNQKSPSSKSETEKELDFVPMGRKKKLKNVQFKKLVHTHISTNKNEIGLIRKYFVDTSEVKYTEEKSFERSGKNHKLNTANLDGGTAALPNGYKKRNGKNGFRHYYHSDDFRLISKKFIAYDSKANCLVLNYNYHGCADCIRNSGGCTLNPAHQKFYKKLLNYDAEKLNSLLEFKETVNIRCLCVICEGEERSYTCFNKLSHNALKLCSCAFCLQKQAREVCLRSEQLRMIMDDGFFPVIPLKP